jgi:hypothetical protein
MDKILWENILSVILHFATRTASQRFVNFGTRTGAFPSTEANQGLKVGNLPEGTHQFRTHSQPR